MIRTPFSYRRAGDNPSTSQFSSTPPVKAQSSDAPQASDSTGIHIWRIVIHTLDGSTEFAVSVRNTVLLGRTDPTTGFTPDIDLTSVDGQDQGVSRHHAIILPTDEGVCIIDLDTPNGTAINDQRLISGRRYRLRTGDRIELGKLRLMVTNMTLVPRGRTQHSTIAINKIAVESD